MAAAKYGYRPDGRALDPWKSNADARALGYNSTTAFRKARGTAEGLSGRAAVGHARKGETSASDLSKVRRLGERAPIDVLRRAALLNARKQFSGSPKYSPQDFAIKVASIESKETLHQLATITADEWRARAALQVPGNPFFYH